MEKTFIMPNCEFIIAHISTHREVIIQLNVEYLSWVFAGIEKQFGVPAEQIVGMSASEYVSSVIDKVCGAPPPQGIFYLLKVDDQVAGMGGFRFLSSGIAELKRIYCRPEFRGMKLGEMMLTRLLSDARTFGYQQVRLDTALFMKNAQRLYERNGFTDCPVYDGVEVPTAYHAQWRFMERML